VILSASEKTLLLVLKPLKCLNPLVTAVNKLKPVDIPKSSQSTLPSFSVKLKIKSTNVFNINSTSVPSPGTNTSIIFPRMDIPIAAIV
jgi:hypothetical protein